MAGLDNNQTRHDIEPCSHSRTCTHTVGAILQVPVIMCAVTVGHLY